MTVLTTERLILRPWRIEDAQDMYAYAKDPNVGPNAGWKPHADIEESRRIIGLFMGKDPQKEEIFAIVDRASGHVVGSLGLEEDGKRSSPGVRSMGYVLSRDCWGRGFMPEAAEAALQYAFETLGLELVSICHYDFNARSRRVIEKLGFRYEGTLRRAHKRVIGGEICDEVCYSMTKKEYMDSRRRAV